jgi:hypothetical protein
MKKILLCVGVCLSITGCGNETAKNVAVAGNMQAIKDDNGGITMYGQCPDYSYSACVTYCKDGACDLIKWDRKKQGKLLFTTIIESCSKTDGKTICTSIK